MSKAKEPDIKPLGTIQRETVEEVEAKWVNPRSEEIKKAVNTVFVVPEEDGDECECAPWEGPEVPEDAVATIKALYYLAENGSVDLSEFLTVKHVREYAILINKIREHLKNRCCDEVTPAFLGDIFTGDESKRYTALGLGPDELCALTNLIIEELDKMGH